MEIVVPDEYKHLYVRNDKRPVYKIPDPVLRAVAKPIDKVGKSVDALVDRMIRVMNLANGVGLAAPQLGVLERVIVIAPVGMKPTAILNPEIMSSEGEMIGQEGCLSIPGLYGDVKRAQKVVVEGFDRKGKPVGYEMEGMPARVVQHEIDHLDGILFIDKVDFATLHWQDPEATDDEVE